MTEMKFEEAFERLEKIVKELEEGELNLDENLKLFEEGIKLSRLCNKQLDDLEAKIEVIMADEKIEKLEVD